MVFAPPSAHLRPAAIAAGVVLKPGQRFGFHNLRHSLATFLINKENDTKTVQGLLRHANVSTTLNLYAQSVNSSMVEVWVPEILAREFRKFWHVLLQPARPPLSSGDACAPRAHRGG